MGFSDRRYANEGPLWGGSRAGPTAWLVGINVAVSVLLWLVGGGLGGSGTRLVIDALAFDTDRLWQIWRPFTCLFLHGSVGHLLGNMLILWFTGRMLEEVFAPRRLVLLYLGFGLAGCLGYLVQMLFSAGPDRGCIGASGAIMGLVVLMGFTFPRRQIIVFVVQMSCAAFAIILVAIDLLQIVAARGMGLTAHSAHLGGAFAGFAFVYLWPRLSVRLDELRRDQERRRKAQEAESRQKDEVEMDRILEKINEAGMGALSERERDFLKRQSERLRKR